MSTVRAIYEKGVFRPIDPVDLPESTHVVFEPRLVNLDAAPSPAMARVYEVLYRSYETALPDLAERHDEHQP
jgi:predicted DNA-binding antitoxin AbrB/MazE fold protein